MGLVDRIRKAHLVKDRESLQPHIRAAVERISSQAPCPACGGTRLNELARSSLVKGKNIAEVSAMQITDLAGWLRGLGTVAQGVRPIVDNLASLLDDFATIGLGYLSLDRESSTLSGGESQRTKMVRHLGSPLSDMTYVFDEPTIGLHAHDVQQMNALLERLRDKGNTVLVVEHDPEVMRVADHVVDMGPGAGTHGGEVVYEGPFAGLAAVGNADRAPPRGAAADQGIGAYSARIHRDPECLLAQPAGRFGGRAAGCSGGGHGCRRFG